MTSDLACIVPTTAQCISGSILMEVEHAHQKVPTEPRCEASSETGGNALAPRINITTLDYLYKILKDGVRKINLPMDATPAAKAWGTHLKLNEERYEEKLRC